MSPRKGHLGCIPNNFTGTELIIYSTSFVSSVSSARNVDCLFLDLLMTDELTIRVATF